MPCAEHADHKDQCEACWEAARPNTAIDALVEDYRALGYRCNRGKRHYNQMIAIRNILSDAEFYKVQNMARREFPTARADRMSSSHVVIRW